MKKCADVFAAPYLGTFVSKRSVDFAALAGQVSALSGLPAIQMKAILRGAFDEFVKLEKEGAVRINFDGGCVCLVVKGMPGGKPPKSYA